MTLQEALNGIEERFDRFYHSVPDEYDKHRRYPFLALPYEKLSTEDRTFGMNRRKAHKQLQDFISECRKCGALVWDATRPDMKPAYHFWRSASQPAFVLSRNLFN